MDVAAAQRRLDETKERLAIERRSPCVDAQSITVWQVKVMIAKEELKKAIAGKVAK
jgi:hypothetical protein